MACSLLTLSFGSDVTTRVGLPKPPPPLSLLLPMPLLLLLLLALPLLPSDALEAGIIEAGGILGRFPDTGRQTQVSIVNTVIVVVISFVVVAPLVVVVDLCFLRIF